MKLISELLTFHKLWWWLAGVFQIVTSSLYALYVDLNFFKTYGWLMVRNMTFAEYLAMQPIEKIADSFNIECDDAISIYDRQSICKNLREMMGSAIYWLLPIPRTIKLQLPYLEHMEIDSKAFEKTKKLFDRLSHENRLKGEQY
eukprot:TRINITY_DN4757_c0_g1_i14.p1 TRINITY_DN4757_c0_g1~~TRINITY_DN4757_c0_g1_i14.p1  ORF type:complete len:144 (+),score=4.01 TRINITY_DN4757_c0_g1_i14:225-656(+)